MKIISARDASLLALLAERPRSKSGMSTRIMRKLAEPAREIATALRSGNHQVSREAAETARGVDTWVKTNKTHLHSNKSTR
jgi:hypothetical protein